MLTVKIKTDNAAFQEDALRRSQDAAGAECACILRKIADKLDNGNIEGVTFDSNGNRVGTYKLTDK